MTTTRAGRRRDQERPVHVGTSPVEDRRAAEDLVDDRSVGEGLSVLLEVALRRVQREERDEQAGDECEATSEAATLAFRLRPGPDDRFAAHRERRVLSGTARAGAA